MEFEFFNAQELDKNLKCSIHRSGKIGFSAATITKLNISQGKSISIGKEKGDLDNKILYMKVNNEIIPSAFPVIKAGDYYYLNTKALFDSLDVDYRNEKVIFDIIELKNGNENIYKLIKRIIGRKDKK